MNKARRAQINKAIELLQLIDQGKADEACSILTDARDEEQEFLDNMPEGLAEGEKGEAAESAIASLDEAIQQLEGIDWATDDDETKGNALEAARESAGDATG
jgi:hypothetical protein